MSEPDRGAIEARIADVLRPLIQSDGGDLELADVSDSEVVVRVSGEAAFGAGSDYVREHVIRDGLIDLIGSHTIRFLKTPRRPKTD